MTSSPLQRVADYCGRKSSTISPSLRTTVLGGLFNRPRTLPPALFYDATGAALFEKISDLPEYYPTRTECSILEQHAGDLARHAGANVALIEYGSGEGVKVQFLLDHLEAPVAYIPVDVSCEQLNEVARKRSAQFPDLQVLPVCADYTRPFELPGLPPRTRRVAFFPGSTIGNFHPTEASAFLHRIRHATGTDGGLILGVDRRKDERVLHAAYNDSAGVTAQFNLNALSHLNHQLGANFNLDNFRHVAFFNDEASRIEMHLESVVDQQVIVDGNEISFEAGETIHTESSYKYDEQRLVALVEGSGFCIEELYTDEREWFWVAWLRPC